MVGFLDIVFFCTSASTRFFQTSYGEPHQQLSGPLAAPQGYMTCGSTDKRSSGPTGFPR